MRWPGGDAQEASAKQRDSQPSEQADARRVRRESYGRRLDTGGEARWGELASAERSPWEGFGTGDTQPDAAAA